MSERLNEIERVLPALSSWPLVVAEIQLQIDAMMERLVASEDPEARGAIKQLRYLIDLPGRLQSERTYLAAGLSDSSDPAQ